MPPALMTGDSGFAPRRTMLFPTSPTLRIKSFEERKNPDPARNWMRAPMPIAWKSWAAACPPRWPAL